MEHATIFDSSITIFMTHCKHSIRRFWSTKQRKSDADVNMIALKPAKDFSIIRFCRILQQVKAINYGFDLFFSRVKFVAAINEQRLTQYLMLSFSRR